MFNIFHIPALKEYLHLRSAATSARRYNMLYQLLINYMFRLCICLFATWV